MIEIKNIQKSYGDFHALKDISLTFKTGETTVIVGPSGSGKSTLLRTLNLLEVPESGILKNGNLEVDFSSKISKETMMAIRKETAMVFQSFNLFPHLSVLENVIEGPITVLKLSKTEATARAKNLLTKVGLADKLDHYPDQLSGGQQQRVAIARALAMEPDFVLFDEPTSALDPELEAEVLRVLKELASEKLSMIIVTHNLDFAREAADRMLFLEDGKVGFDGPTKDFFESTTEPRIARFINSITI
ncbi:amino acid ABC transporter ATP-binding protein [Trichococcus shcherbakoviae]|jgi:cystine transport system ATP-binding protein|uniref:Amino acid ABC transporter ATP-binding protein n=1 Tax=Trichococcus shcherbakoviae subsp. psychrophilus TaxID=2585775 RepID=A0A5C5EDX4_9LACT|nr:amino acid ABC transporter ATP-binding protein [Trichococcus shcherbakoviae]OUL08343.1 arginine ABC transporter ATP-binding protein ArtP [Sedimentibacter sp. SX930]TNV70415.1 amino acid ABC transporter ATP-binding protein [Trichococcus shcherbakoviae subsp. psychrophilus]